jgi:ParB family chromosome partitioning protein
LGALLSSSSETTTTAPPIELPITAISPNPNQPRKDFDDKALRDLSDSLRHSGLLQPLVVRRVGDGYQLIVGERRWRAAKLAGIERVPVIVRDASDSESLELALVENLLREDLNPMEEAEAYQRLLAEFGWTQEELAQRVGRDRSTIANCLRLVKLPDLVQADLACRRLTMGHARALLLPGRAQDDNSDFARRSWRTRGRCARPKQDVQRSRTKSPRRPARRAPEISGGRRLAALGTRHAGAPDRQRERWPHRGRPYSSREELDRLVEQIVGHTHALVS